MARYVTHVTTQSPVDIAGVTLSAGTYEVAHGICSANGLFLEVYNEHEDRVVELDRKDTLTLQRLYCYMKKLGAVAQV